MCCRLVQIRKAEVRDLMDKKKYSTWEMKYQSDSGNVAKKFVCYFLAINLWQVT